MTTTLTSNVYSLFVLDRTKKGKWLVFSLVFLMFIGIVVWIQNYFKYGDGEYFSAKLSLVYNLIVYSSFALLTPLILLVAGKLPFNSGGKLKSIGIHFLISAGVCLVYMMLSNIILYFMGLVSAIPLPQFIWKYLTGVIHVHFLIYWAIYGMVSISMRYKIKSSANSNGTTIDRFKVSMNNQQYFVPYQEVYWIEALDHYQKLHTESGYHIIKDSMTSLEKRMPAEMFCRAHRSYFVNVTKVQSIYKNNSRGHFIKLSNNTSLKISDSYKSLLLSVVNS